MAAKQTGWWEPAGGGVAAKQTGWWEPAGGAPWKCSLFPIREHGKLISVRIISRKALRDFWARHPDAEAPLRSWFDDARRAILRTPNEIKSVYRNASFVGNNRVVFNIKGNDYRLVVAINYPAGIVYVCFVGTHAQYDKVDVANV